MIKHIIFSINFFVLYFNSFNHFFFRLAHFSFEMKIKIKINQNLTEF